MEVQAGDLLHGDRHGIQTIPLTIASEIPQVAQRILRSESELIQFCKSPQFSLKGLSDRLKQASKDDPCA